MNELRIAVVENPRRFDRDHFVFRSREKFPQKYIETVTWHGRQLLVPLTRDSMEERLSLMDVSEVDTRVLSFWSSVFRRRRKGGFASGGRATPHSHHEVVIACGAEEVAHHPRSHEREGLRLRPAALASPLGSEDRCLDQAAPLVGWEPLAEFVTLHRRLEARMRKLGKQEFA